jgi:uncharacterized membrane protein
MTKAADNERHKLRAAFFNNMAVGMVLAGILLPYLALVSKANEMNEWLGHVITGTVVISQADWQRIIVAVLPFVLAFWAARYFRKWADQEVAKITD